jgi:AAA15 family ATPase/GTPase
LQLPYSSIADTLQRIIFYKTAIASNTNSVLLFEEPEAHAFPPYIRTVANDIANSKSNQFFIATHSPIIVNEFIEDAEVCKELAIYIVDFKNSETIVKRLSDNDLNEIFDNGIDLFFDLERYLN